MTYAKAIETNQTALRRVIEEIYVILEIVLNGTVKHLPQALQFAAYRLLVPAESALRRLIVIAARGLKVKLPKPRPAAQVLVIKSKGTRPLPFQLFDKRKRFNRKPSQKIASLIPRIHIFGNSSLTWQPLLEAKKQNSSIVICRRFAAFKTALENIPREAKRLALWQLKRTIMKCPKFLQPLRPGAPPGFNRSLTLKIDCILNECHHLAKLALREAPS